MLMPTVTFKHSVRVTRVPEVSFNYKICHYCEQSQHLWPLKTETWRTYMTTLLSKKRARVLETQDHPYSSLNSNHRNGGRLRYKKFSEVLGSGRCFQHFGGCPIQTRAKYFEINPDQAKMLSRTGLYRFNRSPWNIVSESKQVEIPCTEVAVNK